MFSQLNDPARWVLPDVLTEMAQIRTDTLWLSDSGGQTMTFSEAQGQSLQAASFFHDIGVERNQRVGVFMFNGCDFVRAWMGLGKLGATAVLLNTELRGQFLKHQLNDSEVSCLVVDSELVPVIAELADELPHVRSLVVAGSADWVPPGHWRRFGWESFRSFPQWTAGGPGAADVACIMYTSGTSGPSKGVLMPHAHCALYGVGAINCLELTSQDRYYISLPLFHANGLLMQLAATLLAGIPAFVRKRFSATNWLSDIRAQCSTVTNLLGSTAAFVVRFFLPPTCHSTSNSSAAGSAFETLFLALA
jgi:crotonobetaine/carnitine-CoA ligase